MAINRVHGSFKKAGADVFDDATILTVELGSISGTPLNLVRALSTKEARNLFLFQNNASHGLYGMS